MAEIDWYVDPDAVGGGDGTSWADAYTSLNAWEAAEETNLVTATDTYIVHCRCSSGTADTSNCIISGWTTNATYNVTVQVDVADRHAGVWDDTKYRIIVTDLTCLGAQEIYTNFYGVQARRNYSSVQWNQAIVPSNTWSASVNECGYCIAETIDGSNSGFMCDAGGTSTTNIFNCIAGPCVGYGFTGANSVVINWYNCAAGRVGRDGFNAAAGNTANAYNCTGACNDAPDVGFNAALDTIDYCASDEGDGTNPQTLAGPAARGDDFTDYAANPPDFSIASGSVQENNGDTNPEGGSLYSDDIIGTSRPQGASWDIGAFEREVAGGVMTAHYYRHLLAGGH